MNNITIEELHDKLFDVLCIVDDICTKNNITYFLDGGTELGSVREKDFIPWDDDMDLTIFLEDLPKFFDAMQKNLPSHLHIVMPDVFCPYFYDFIIRIYDDRYLLRKETEEDRAYGNFQNRIGTDVFIISKAPNNFLLRKLLLLKVKILYGLGMAHRYKIDYKKYSLLQKIQVFVLTSIGKFFSAKNIYKYFFKTISKWNAKKTKYGFPANGNLNSIFFYQNKWYLQKTFGTLRNRKFPIPQEYDKKLTALYGNYIIPTKNEKKYIKHL